MEHESRDPDIPFDPSSFDVDAFLAETQQNSVDLDTDSMETEAKEIAVENIVMNALERVGFPVGPIREAQSRLAPEKPLSRAYCKMMEMQESLVTEQDVEEVVALHTLIVTTFAILKVAGEKLASNMLNTEAQPESKQQQQAYIYADDDLSAEYKSLFLAAIEELYPGVEGLAPDDPSTLLSIEEYTERQKIDEDVRVKSRVLRDLADTELRNAMAEHGLGQHDQLDSIASYTTMLLTRMHVIESGEYPAEYREMAQLAAETSLYGSMLSEAKAMGWSEDQFEAIVQHVRDCLRAAEQE